jgi:membrane protein implicated in regulation of membrane protease activity
VPAAGEAGGSRHAPLKNPLRLVDSDFMRDPYAAYKRTGKVSDEIAGFGNTILIGLLLLVLVVLVFMLGKQVVLGVGWLLGLLPPDLAVIVGAIGTIVIVSLSVLWVRDLGKEGRPAPNVSPELVDEARLAGLDPTETEWIADGAKRVTAAREWGGEIDCTDLDAELQRVYVQAGVPFGYREAKAKVLALARDLTLETDFAPDEALYFAYQRSLREHRDALARRGG